MFPTFTSIAVIVCDTEGHAVQKEQFLKDSGFATAIEKVNSAISYDAAEFGGGLTDAPTGKWMVTGRRA